MKSLCVLGMMGLVVVAQDVRMVRMEAPSLQAQLLSSRWGLLVVLDDAEKTWSRHLKELEAKDPLLDVGLASTIVPAARDGRLASELMARYQWGAGPRWAYLSKQGQVLAEGTSLPTPEAILEALKRAGYQDPLLALERFHQSHPNHAEGHLDLLLMQYRRAQRRMEPLLKPLEDAPANRLVMVGETVAFREPDRELLRPLNERDDARIWGSAADTLMRLLGNPAWMGLADQYVAPPAVARCSPRMKRVCQRWLTEVESALQRNPSQRMLWTAWVGLARVVGDRPMRSVLSVLKSLPGADPLPPDAVLDVYVLECRTNQAWQELKEVLLPRWQRPNTRVQRVVMALNGTTAAPDPFKSTWDRMVAPLVEACLRTQDLPLAEQVVKEALEKYRSRNLSTWASQLALACRQPQLAQAWAALPLPKE